MTDDLRPGELIGERYRVLGALGRGGMASVYLAEDTTLSREVAIKVLHSRFAQDEKFVERFRREAKAAAGLNHPNIVSVYDWGRLGNQNYIVMEYVQGETLKDRIRRQGRLDGDQAVAIALELLAAIAAAHSRGVVHRDVKSQNILIDAEGRVKVADFGIAQAGDPSMTEAGSVLGTAQYLAPEQARGEPVDERSDLYSVGVVLYEMLTGTVPFKGDSAVTVALKHVNEAPPEPAELVPGLPYALNQVVLKALAKDPALRYAGAAELIADLRAAQAGGPLLAAAYDPGLERTQMMGATMAGEQATRVMTARDRAAARAAAGRGGRSDAGDKKRRTPWWVWLLIAVIVVGLAVAGVFIYQAAFAANASVPDVVGLNERSATARLEEDGFKAKVNDGYSAEYAQGFVYRQQPVADTELREGGTVEIWVSRGTPTVELTSFREWTPDRVEAWLKENGLVGERRSGANDNVAKGLVYKQSPAAGEEVARGDTVTYWVSSGPGKVEVPDVTGMSAADAAALLEDSGLDVGNTTEEPSETFSAGAVISQDPPAGRMVARGTAVDLVISTGSPSPTTSPSPSPTLVEVPPVLSMMEADATSTLEAAGFVVAVNYVTGAQPAGTVVDQDPAAGSQAEAGSTVTITVDQD
jgi:serine/threonine-protein kinase